MLLFLILLSYLLGSIPSGLWIGQAFYHKDIRQFGSGNTGSTNTFRTLGKIAGSIVLILDILKGTLPTLLAIWYLPQIHPITIGIFAILGHTFSLFAQFKGGKAVATSAGVVLAIQPLLLLCGVLLFATFLYFTRMVSLASMLTASLLTIASIFLDDWLFMAFAAIITLFIIYRHRSNIVRIKNGVESKVPFGYRAK